MAKKNNLKNNQIIYDDYVFTRDSKSGYYLSARPISNNKRIMLHRYVYEKYNGPVPQGYCIHHINQDKENNDISNLTLMQGKKHSQLHSIQRIYSNYDEEVEKFINRTNNKAKEWHKSKEGKEWHRQHAVDSIVKSSKTAVKSICSVCGKEYLTAKTAQNRAKFCSKSCKSKYRRDNHLDYVNRKCVICGSEFSTNKYCASKTCSNDCKRKLLSISRAKRVTA